MELDLTARRNLELTETLRSKEKRGSLLWVLDRTRTAMGGRLLRSWLERPLLDVAAIRRRSAAVEALVADTVDNWNGDITEYDVDIRKLTVTMDVTNKIPLNLELSVLPIDVDGNVMPADEVKVAVPERILPGNGLEGNPDGGTLTSVTVEMETLKEGALRRLDGIVFDVRANNSDDADYQNIPLNENQTLKLDNIRIRIPEGVKLDLNDNDDK